MNAPTTARLTTVDITPVLSFLACSTADAWFDEALKQIETLLIDHANCEKKAAASAMNLMYRHTTIPSLLTKMSQLAREELLHFQQVVEIMVERGVNYRRLGPSRYASRLREQIGKQENVALRDTLIIGAIIEARSCERFAGLVPRLESKGEQKLAKFYHSLLKSEARHFEDYLELANNCDEADTEQRLQEFLVLEADLVSTQDASFRFHSGVPA